MSSHSTTLATPGIFVLRIGEGERALAHEVCSGFVPDRLFDLHAHLLIPEHFPESAWPPYLKRSDSLGFAAYRQATTDIFGQRRLDGLFFGFPARGNSVEQINEWITGEVHQYGDRSAALWLARPTDDPAAVERQLAAGSVVGIKPYHLYASSHATEQALVETFAPEWMWSACHDHAGILMLHIMRDGGISDPANRSALERLLRKYPQCQVVLAHVARSFNYRTARGHLEWLAEFENAWLDTSAVTETETFRIAIAELGAGRLCYGSDFPISNIRGKSVTISGAPYWIYGHNREYKDGQMAIAGIESLRCLREACEDAGLDQEDIEAIFYRNAMRVLRRVPEPAETDSLSGPERWRHAKEVISCGTGLRSKWAELYDPATWPSYFSRCQGSRIWDFSGREYIDFGAGAGAIVLGYSDPVVNRAVRRQIGKGTYCTLLSGREVELAELLLDLHPWAGRVRFARGGGEAMGVAVRIARAATGRSGVVFCGYHGWQDWYLAANLGDSQSLDGHLLPGLQPAGVPRELRGTAFTFKYNDLASFEAALVSLDGPPAAIVMEPMRTQWPDPGFLEAIRSRSRELGAVLIMDEITSGWRFGFPGATGRFGVEPDVAVYAKAMSNGFPCAAVVGRTEIMDLANASFISSSYWTDAAGPAAALASVTRMRDLKVHEAVWSRGEDFQTRLSSLMSQAGQSRPFTMGMPCNPYVGFDLGELSNQAKVAFIRKMAMRGILLAGANYIMFTHTDRMFEAFLDAASEALGEVDDLVHRGDLADYVGTNAGIGNFSRLT